MEFAIITRSGGGARHITARLVTKVPPAWRMNGTVKRTPWDYSRSPFANHANAAIELGFRIALALPHPMDCELERSMPMVDSRGRQAKDQAWIHCFNITKPAGI